MNSIEIIGAVIDDGLVTSDPYVIDASIALGRQIEYLSREEARELAEIHPTSLWHRLADAPTLFICHNGVRYRVRQHRSTSRVTENRLESVVSSTLSELEYTSFRQIVVGTDAATSDVLGAIDLAASLQAASTIQQTVEVPGAAGKTVLTGDVVEIGDASE